MHLWDVVNHLVYCPIAKVFLPIRKKLGLLPHCQGFFTNKKKKLVYYPIAKVASTTWVSNFLAWSKKNRSSVHLVLSQFKEAGTFMKNEKAEAGGRGIRTLARCHNLSLNLKGSLDTHRYIYQAPEAASLEDLTSQFKENTGLLLVRHPLVRLVSAYEDKMLNPHPFPYAFHHRQGENRLDRWLT